MRKIGLENDLIRLFDYVDPADTNLGTYSHELYQLLLSASTEVETNAKAILSANGYKAKRLDVQDYCKIEKACRLSEYTVVIPAWHGARNRRQPFAAWKTSHSLSWYQDYNNVKHDRFANFQLANLSNALDAITAVFVLLFAQFHSFAFDPYRTVTFMHWEDDVMFSPECLLQIVLPTWPESERYDFDQVALKSAAKPFQAFSF